MASDMDAIRARLEAEHQKAKHSETCWKCDRPWPCDVMASLIDADHDWALWREKWCAALDIVGNRSEEVARLTAEMERLRCEVQTYQEQNPEAATQGGYARERADRIRAEAALAEAIMFLRRGAYAGKEIVSTGRLTELQIANYRTAGLIYVEPGGGLGWVVRDSAPPWWQQDQEAALALVEEQLKAVSEDSIRMQDELAAANERVAELERRSRLTHGSLSCGDCGGPHLFDTSVPSVVWNAVIRARGMSEYLCTSCIVKAFVQAGVSFTAQLWGDDLPHGAPIEVRVGGEVATDAAKISEENTVLRVKLEAANERAEKLGDLLKMVTDILETDGNWTNTVRELHEALRPAADPPVTVASVFGGAADRQDDLDAAPPEAPDKNCFTRADGECISDKPCMHSAPEAKPLPLGHPFDAPLATGDSVGPWSLCRKCQQPESAHHPPEEKDSL